MKQKMLAAAEKAKPIAKKAAAHVPALSMAAILVCSNVAFASDGSDMFKYVVKILGAFAMAGGALMAVMGGMAYAEAKSEGEGPAMAKAKNQLTAAVLLILMGVFLTGGATQIANLVSNIDLG